jgi:hypothetical protein
MKLKRSENDVLRAICQYLKAKQYFWWRQNNVGIWDKERKSYRTSQFLMKGVPDIFCMKYNGIENENSDYSTTIQNKNSFTFSFLKLFYAIEVKSSIGKQSQDQKYFQEQFEKHGGIYVLARGIEDVQKVGL